MLKNNKTEFSVNDYRLKNGIVYGIAFFCMLLSLRIYSSERIHAYIIKNITTSNIIPYMCLVLIFIATVIVCNMILLKLSIVQKINRANPIVSKIIAFGIVLINVAMLLYVYKTELKTYDSPEGLRLQYHVNDTITIILMVGVFFAVVYFIEALKEAFYSKKESRIVFYIFVIVIAFVYGYTLYTPNCLSTYANLHHGDAYFNSVYRAMMGVPRSYLNTGIYGCYAIILAPIVNLLGGTLSSFFIVIGCLGGISIICMAYAIDTLTKNPIIKVIGTVALTTTVMATQWSIYPQLYPHRVVFPAILIAYMAFVYRHKRGGIGWTIGGYIVCTVAIIWNTEIGMACLVAWMAYELYDAFVKYNVIQISLYKNIVIHILAGIGSFFGAILIVNVVNLLMGGGLVSIQDFLFPLLTPSYMEDVLIIALPKTFTAWLLVVGLFLFLLAHCIMKTKISPKRLPSTTKDKVFCGIAVLGLGQITYFVNRATYGNLGIGHYISILIVCIIADWSLQKYVLNEENNTHLLNNIYRGLAYITTTVLILITLAGASNYFGVEIYKTLIDTNYRNTDMVESFTKEFEESIPKDTKAIGNGVVELYSYLHWDPYYYIIDFSDIGVLPDAAYYMNNELAKLDEPVLINADSLAKLDAFSENGNKEFYEKNVLVKTFPIYNLEFRYYVPVKAN